MLEAGAFSERDKGLNPWKGKERFSLPSGNIYILNLENLILPEGYIGCILSYGPHECYFIYPQNQVGYRHNYSPFMNNQWVGQKSEEHDQSSSW